MNTLSAVVRKSVLPLSGLLLTLAVVWQIRGQGRPSIPFLDQLGASPAAASEATAPVATTDTGRVVAEGRMVAYPGAEVEVAADLSGTLVRFLVKERDTVRKGQLIAELRADDPGRAPDCRPGRYVVVEVADTGCGMADEVKARIFEPFFTTKGNGLGTGLGLPTAYAIVNQAGGSITVRSTPGKGTRFDVLLPESRTKGGNGAK